MTRTAPPDRPNSMRSRRKKDLPKNRNLNTRPPRGTPTIRIRSLILSVLIDTIPTEIALVVDMFDVDRLAARGGGTALLAGVRGLRKVEGRGGADEGVAGEGAAEAAGGLTR